MNQKDLFDRSVFLIGAGASRDANCLTSNQMLVQLKSRIKNLDAPREDGSDDPYKGFQTEFKEIYEFIFASLNYQFSLKSPELNGTTYLNIEDFVMVLKQLIDREFIIPYPLVGNWNEKIVRWEMKRNDGNIFASFLSFIIHLLSKEWISFDLDKAKEYLQPLKELIVNSEDFKVNIFSLNYDLVLESVFNSSQEKTLETGFSVKKVHDEGGDKELKIWNDEILSDEVSDVKILLYKLHGSVNWEYDQSYELIKEKDQEDLSDKEPLIIFGSNSKMLSFDPFLHILSEFRRKLSRSNLFIVIGYSFHDKYINNLLIQQLAMESNKRLVIVDPALKDKTSEDFVKELEKIQTIKSVNDVINFKRTTPEKVILIPLTTKEFFKDYFGDGAKKLITILDEAIKEETIF